MIFDKEAIRQKLKESIKKYKSAKKILLIPPDATRSHSGGGLITSLYYEMFCEMGIHADILPALGSHAPMTRQEQIDFYGDIPEERFLTHRWRDGVISLGEIPASFVQEVSEELMDKPIAVQVSEYLLQYDQIISIGQVVPHEVAGMANYTKNIVVGCGGSDFINASHMIGAFYGIERVLGKVDTPVRHLFDYAEEHYLKCLPITYVLTVVDGADIVGLFVGRERDIFEEAAALSQKRNIIYLDKPLESCVVHLDEKEFHSTWLGNKAIYRTRMAIADGGHLIVVAPGVRMFGEDSENDRLIRKFGYVGRQNVLQLSNTESELQNNLAVAAHLIHGSTDGRFKVTYAAPLLGKKAVESVGYNYIDIDKVMELDEYSGFHIHNPALGLWQVGK